MRDFKWLLPGCLKLLPPDELEYLDYPPVGKPSHPVKEVLYLSETDKFYVGGNNSLPQDHTEGTRFNLFTGYQTLEEREQSYKVSSTIITLKLVCNLCMFITIGVCVL